MKKKSMRLTAFGLLVLMAGCSDDLTRIDIEHAGANEPITVAEEKDVQELGDVFEQVKWEPEIEPKMAREEDVRAVLFVEEELNMPERLYTYEIWLDEDGAAELISDKEGEGYGTLPKKQTEELKKWLE